MALADVGRVKVDTRHPNYWKVTINVSAAQTATALVAAPGASKHLVLTDIIMSALTANTIKLVENTTSAVDIHEIVYLGNNGNYEHGFEMPMALSSNVNLGFTSSASAAHSVTATGYTEAD